MVDHVGTVTTLLLTFSCPRGCIRSLKILVGQCCWREAAFPFFFSTSGFLSLKMLCVFVRKTYFLDLVQDIFDEVDI